MFRDVDFDFEVAAGIDLREIRHLALESANNRSKLIPWRAFFLKIAAHNVEMNVVSVVSVALNVNG
jgi:hypothetical protein